MLEVQIKIIFACTSLEKLMMGGGGGAEASSAFFFWSNAKHFKYFFLRLHDFFSFGETYLLGRTWMDEIDDQTPYMWLFRAVGGVGGCSPPTISQTVPDLPSHTHFA